MNAVEAGKVDQDVTAVEAFAASNTVIFVLAVGTIEQTLAKSDLELSVETLAGALTRQANRFPDASPVRVRHPLTADDTDEAVVAGAGGGTIALGEWDIVVTDDRLVERVGRQREPRSAAARARRSACDRSSPRSAVPRVRCRQQPTGSRSSRLWAERARGEPAAFGERGDEPQRSGPPLDQAVIGDTNKESAAQLFLSPRTVGHHLYKAYPKLGVTGRAELTDLVQPAAGEP